MLIFSPTLGSCLYLKIKSAVPFCTTHAERGEKGESGERRLAWHSLNRYGLNTCLPCFRADWDAFAGAQEFTNRGRETSALDGRQTDAHIINRSSRRYVQRGQSWAQTRKRTHNNARRDGEEPYFKYCGPRQSGMGQGRCLIDPYQNERPRF